MEIRLLCDYRETLVNERTRLINRLWINLVILDPELEASIPSRKLDYPAASTRHTPFARDAVDRAGAGRPRAGQADPECSRAKRRS